MAQSPANSRTADVAVIGGGVIGCAIAFRLAQERLKVIVVERGEFGGEASSAAAGMIAPQGEMVEYGPFFELCAASRDLYPKFLAEIEDVTGNESGHALGYHRDGTLIVATSETESRELERVYEEQKRHGLAVERLDAEEVHRTCAGLSPETRWGALVPGDHRIDNERLTPALVEAGRKLGVTYLAHTAVHKLNLEKQRLVSVEAGDNGAGASLYSAEEFVLAAGSWSGELAKSFGMALPIEPCRGQMIEFESPSPADFRLVVRHGLHYIVPRAPHRVLVGTTSEYAGYEKGVTGEGLRSILEGAARLAPFVRNLRFRRAWAGLRPDTADHLPILGYGDIENLVFATGHFRNGILLTPITAELISQVILGGSLSHSLDPYGPGRFLARRSSSVPVSDTQAHPFDSRNHPRNIAVPRN